MSHTSKKATVPTATTPAGETTTAISPEKKSKKDKKAAKADAKDKATKADAKDKATKVATVLNAAKTEETARRSTIYKFQQAEEKVTAAKAKSLRASARNTLRKLVELCLVHSKAGKKEQLAAELKNFRKFIDETYVSRDAVYQGQNEDFSDSIRKVMGMLNKA